MANSQLGYGKSVNSPAAVKSNGLQKSHPGTLVPGGNSTHCGGFSSPLLSGLRALAALKQVWLQVHRSNTLTIMQNINIDFALFGDTEGDISAKNIIQ